MTLLDAAASTAFAALRPTSSGGDGVVQAGGREGTHGAGARASAATRLGRIDPAAPSSFSSDEKSTGLGLERQRERLFSFGAIADVQYADQDDGWNFEREHKRYYRGGLRQLTGAVDVWLRDETHRFALQLGDVIDGSNKRQRRSEAALRSVKAEIDRLAASLPLGVLNSLGNHELYNFPKKRWAQELDCSNRANAVALRPSSSVASSSEPRWDTGGDGGSEFSALPAESSSSEHEATSAAAAAAAAAAAEGEESSRGHEDEQRFYYSFCPDDSYRFIALDTYDVNAIRQEPRRRGGGKKREGEVDGVAQKGAGLLAKHNPNADKNDGGGMKGLQKRFVRYNGGVGVRQLAWLEEQLAQASRAGQRVVGFSHVPIHPAEPSAHTLLWNYEDVLGVMHKFDCVAMFLSGHRHRETYVRDANGIHHISLAAALEAPSDKEAFASIDVYPDCLELRGHGMVESRTLDLTPLSKVL